MTTRLVLGDTSDRRNSRNSSQSVSLPPTLHCQRGAVLGRGAVRTEGLPLMSAPSRLEEMALSDFMTPPGCFQVARLPLGSAPWISGSMTAFTVSGHFFTQVEATGLLGFSSQSAATGDCVPVQRFIWEKGMSPFHTSLKKSHLSY